MIFFAGAFPDEVISNEGFSVVFVQYRRYTPASSAKRFTIAEVDNQYV